MIEIVAVVAALYAFGGLAVGEYYLLGRRRSGLEPDWNAYMYGVVRWPLVLYRMWRGR